MIITEKLVMEGVSERGGWNRRQIILLGAKWPLSPGWKNRVIGQPISDSDADLFLSLKGQTIRAAKSRSNKVQSELPFPVDLPTDSARVADSFWVWVNRQPRSIREKLQESLIYMARKNIQVTSETAPAVNPRRVEPVPFAPPERKVFARHVSREYKRPEFDPTGNDEGSETPPW